MDCTYFVILKDDHPELGNNIGLMGRSPLRLLEAIRDGDPQKLESLLSDRFFKLPVKDFVYIFSLLARLVKDKKVHLSIAVLIVKYGLNNYRGVLAPKMYRLYRWAVQLNSPAIVKILLDAGLGVNEKIDLDDTLLSYAVTNGQSNESIVSLLLSQGAEINSKDNHGLLYWAVKTGNTSMVQLLLNNHADPAETNINGNNCLHACARNGHSSVKIAKLLIKKGTPLNVWNEHGRTPLHFAAMRKCEKLVRLYIEHGADVNALSKDGATALSIAAEFNRRSSVKLLLKSGADVNKGKTTALHKARDENVIELLLEYGADVNTKEKESGLTALSNLSKLNVNSKRIIVKHVASLAAQNLRVDERNMAYIRADEETCNFYEKCREELEKMSEEVFYNKISYYYVYRAEMRKLLPLFRNDEFVESFKSKRIEKLFPLYNYEIYRKFRRCLTENTRLEFLKKSFELKVAAVFPGQSLPDLVKDKIFSYYVY